MSCGPSWPRQSQRTVVRTMATTDRDANSTRLVAYCRANLPPQEDWEPFIGYPDSLALAVTDAIWSMGARYAITRGVIQRYAAYRRSLGGNPEHDGLRELVQVYEQLGGSDQFIDAIGTRNRVSTARGASRKGEVVLEAAHRLLRGECTIRSVIGLWVDKVLFRSEWSSRENAEAGSSTVPCVDLLQLATGSSRSG